ncbi:uncharacterized protein LOC100821777 isoform X1 [Brachypodium distachyon]|uniref:uncharacterized protein LOC100821777 isoform X1 n=1 Tax=Brachypodium distachyon TaxID=15368 RepID=UPI00071E3696|nr:uncharacterized protein LOC100821777 isoform X1 [Brachypodium distachyon]|eukprot:XP_014758898.1 uncharacterized protein LOC100821777 isoform X1 [Brachypodium distachyon]
MAWWRKKVVFPARRVLAAVSSRVVRTRKTALVSAGSGGSILKLHGDVQTCGYKDVQVMFEILTSSELDEPSKRRKQPATAWRPPSAWPSRSSSSIAAAQ